MSGESKDNEASDVILGLMASAIAAQAEKEVIELKKQIEEKKGASKDKADKKTSCCTIM